MRRRATLIFHRKRYYDDGAIAEFTLWLVPAPVRGSDHRFKYSLYYGCAGERLVAYDNEPGRGDHRHYRDREELYPFTTPDQLIRDFLTDIRNHRRGTTPNG